MIYFICLALSRPHMIDFRCIDAHTLTHTHKPIVIVREWKKEEMEVSEQASPWCLTKLLWSHYDLALFVFRYVILLFVFIIFFLIFFSSTSDVIVVWEHERTAFAIQQTIHVAQAISASQPIQESNVMLNFFVLVFFSSSSSSSFSSSLLLARSLFGSSVYCESVRAPECACGSIIIINFFFFLLRWFFFFFYFFYFFYVCCSAG